jgi:hypothetical protein
MLPYMKQRLEVTYEELLRDLVTNGGLKGISGMEGGT